jgi:hypothetical protein
MGSLKRNETDAKLGLKLKHDGQALRWNFSRWHRTKVRSKSEANNADLKRTWQNTTTHDP